MEIISEIVEKQISFHQACRSRNVEKIQELLNDLQMNPDPLHPVL